MPNKPIEKVLDEFTPHQSSRPEVVAGVAELRGVDRQHIEQVLSIHLESLDGTDLRKLQEVCDFLQLPDGGGLSEEEVEQPETLARELLNVDGKAAQFFCKLMRQGEGGNILSVVYGSHNPQTDILLVRFQATLTQVRTSGASQYLLSEALRNVQPALSALEGVEASERYWNRFKIAQGGAGHRRVYRHPREGLLTEFKYELPPLDYDPASGENTMDGVPEHLMVAKRDVGNVMQGSEVQNVVANGFGADWYEWDRKRFDNKAAYVKHLQITRRVQAQIAGQVGPTESLYALSATERRYLEDEGYTVEHHKV